MKFNLKFVFVVLASVLVGYALYDYKNQEVREKLKTQESQVLPEVYIGDVQQIVVSRPLGELKIVREATGLQIKSPIEDQAGYEQMDSYWTTLSTRELKEVEVSGPISWADYGLEQPEAQFEIDYKNGQKLVLQLGSIRTVEEGYYLRKNNENKVYTTSSDWTDLALKLADDLRDPQIFSKTPEPQKIELKTKSAKDSWRLEKNGSDWALTQPKAQFKLSTEAIEAYIYLLRHLEAEKVLAATEPKGALEMTVDYNDLRLEIFSDQKSVRVASSTRPQALFEISKQKASKLKAPFVQFYDRSLPFQFEAPQVTKIDWRQAEQPLAKKWLKLESGWVYDTESAHEAADPVKIEAFINQLRSLAAHQYTQEHKVNAKQATKINFKNNEFKTVFEISWGGTVEQDGETYYVAKTSQLDSHFLMSQSVLDELAKSSLNKAQDDQNK